MFMYFAQHITAIPNKVTSSANGTMESHCVSFPESYLAELFSKFENMRRALSLCDIIIKIDDKAFYAHRVILAASSAYFEAMFSSGMTESTNSEIKLKGLECSAFDAILDFIYTGKVNLCKENIQVVLSAASMLHIHRLKQECSELLASYVTPLNCLGIKAFAESHGCDDLARCAMACGLTRFNEVTAGEEFLLLPAEQLEEIISNDSLNTQSEEDVFDAICDWVNYDHTTRSPCFPAFFRHVRLPQVPPVCIADKIRTNKLVQGSMECRDWLDEILISCFLIPERRTNIPLQQTRPRASAVGGYAIYVIGGLNSVEGIQATMERYEMSKGTWELSKPMNTVRSRVGVAVVGGKLYSIGGFDGAARLATVECYNPVLDEWTTVSPMTTKRSALAVAAVGEDLYVIGGYDGIASLCSVEIYHTRTDTWRHGVPMHARRSASGVAVLQNSIYVVGGHDGSSIFSTAEQYDIQNCTWRMIPSMHNKRCRLGVAATSGLLFSIGGYDGASFLNTAESFNPATEQWTIIQPMNCCRSRIGVVAVSNHIFAIGGVDGSSNLNSMEVFDPDKQSWSSGPSMRWQHGGVSVGLISPAM